MVRKKKKRGEIWWLARGHTSCSRQPSFAPPTARPVVTSTYYGFGWHREKACFVKSQKPDILLPARIEDYPCDLKVAEGILKCCAYKYVQERFFDNPFAKEGDADIFAAAGHMFGITLSRYSGRPYRLYAEASLHFYAPDGTRQTINFHNGMSRSFGHTISGMRVPEIRQHMQ